MKLPQDFFKKVVIGFIAGIFLIQILSLLVSSIFPSVEVIKAGNSLLIMLVAIGVITLFNVGFSVEKLKSKENLIFVVIVFGLIGLSFWKGPEYFPQIFSISPEFSESIKSNIGSIIGVGG
jgi:uncharacterized membrane protein